MRTANTHKNQLINFKQNNDFPALEAALKETENDLRGSLDELVKADAKANRIKVLVRDLLEQLYSDNGMVQLYRELHQLNILQGQQLSIVDQRLNQGTTCGRTVQFADTGAIESVTRTSRQYQPPEPEHDYYPIGWRNSNRCSDQCPDRTYDIFTAKTDDEKAIRPGRR